MCDTYKGEGCAFDSYLKCDGCLSSFIRGIFCAAGSISDPHKSYTLEIILPTKERAEQLKIKLEENGLIAGIVERKRHQNKQELKIRNGIKTQESGKILVGNFKQNGGDKRDHDTLQKQRSATHNPNNALHQIREGLKF